MLRSKKIHYDNLSPNEDHAYAMPELTARAPRVRTLEAQIQPDDTIAKIALRFHCSVMDIKTLNKIHNDNEIFAFKVLKVPLTPQNVLLDTLPKVHLSSGENSPTKKKIESLPATSTSKENAHHLEEKLLVASVCNATIVQSEDVSAAEEAAEDVDSPHAPLNRSFRGYPRAIAAPKIDYLDFDGSDWDMNWICLLICILAVCVIVPLIYVFLVYEHPEKFVHEHSRYDDPEVKVFHHINGTHVMDHH